jgi:tetratricopeptide (TPR) repeat protein
MRARNRLSRRLTGGCVRMTTEEETGTFERQPTQVRRRAAVLAGIGVVWAAFMASVGLLLLAGLVLLGAAAGVAWILGVRVPQVDVARVAASAAGMARSTRSAAAAAGSRAVAFSRRALATSRGATASSVHRLASIGKETAATARQSVPKPRIPQPRRRRDPRIDEALASNSQGIALAKAGKHAEAIDAFDAALALLADTGDRHHEGQVLVNLGVVHRKVGGAEAARFCWVRALERLEPGTRESERTEELLGVR